MASPIFTKIGVLPFFDALYKIALLFFENSTRKKFRFSLQYTDLFKNHENIFKIKSVTWLATCKKAHMKIFFIYSCGSPCKWLTLDSIWLESETLAVNLLSFMQYRHQLYHMNRHYNNPHQNESINLDMICMRFRLLVLAKNFLLKNFSHF